LLGLKKAHQPFDQIQPLLCKDGHEDQEENEDGDQLGIADFGVFSFYNKKENGARRQYNQVQKGEKLKKSIHSDLLVSKISQQPSEKAVMVQSIKKAESKFGLFVHK